MQQQRPALQFLAIADVLQAFNKYVENLKLSFPDLASPGLPPRNFRADGCKCFLSWDYSSVDVEKPPGHAPPWQVCKQSMDHCHGEFGRGCQEMECCQNKACKGCDACPMHVDSRDRSVTVLLLQQSGRVRSKCAWFLAGDEAWVIDGGLLVIFDAATLPHGVYAPMDAQGWKGISFVRWV